MEKTKTGAKVKSDKESHINVVVRCRPLNSAERKKCAVPVLKLRKNAVTVSQESGSKTFTYDHVFGPNSTQMEVFETTVQPMVEEVLLGYNCTMFAYGQTGTGKTFTMEGERTTGGSYSWADDPLAGIIPRTLQMLFDKLDGQDFTVRVSFIEIYNEEIMDLMGDSLRGDKIKIFDDANKKGAVLLQGVEEVTVKDRDHVYQILERGSNRRKTAETQMNAHSSRSHSVFSVTVQMKDSSEHGEELLRTGKLNMVDLAGSENIGRSGAVELRAREAGNINQSLLTLGRCITALVEKKPHVPYRESKLTRILQDSLGGRTKTCMIATVSPASCNIEETLSSLEYAHRAKHITNRPEINQKMTKQAMIRQYVDEIERLKKDLSAQREQRGIFVSPENYELMEGKLKQQDEYIQYTEEQLSFAQEELKKFMDLYKDSEEIIAAKEQMIEEITNALRRVENELQETKELTVEQQFLLEKKEETEKRLQDEADKLLKSVEESVGDNARLHGSLERKRKLESTNEHAKAAFRHEYSNLCTKTTQAVDQLVTLNCARSDRLNKLIDEKVQQNCCLLRETYTSVVQEMSRQLHHSHSTFMNTNEENGSSGLSTILSSFTRIDEKFKLLLDDHTRQTRHALTQRQIEETQFRNKLTEILDSWTRADQQREERHNQLMQQYDALQCRLDETTKRAEAVNRSNTEELEEVVRAATSCLQKMKERSQETETDLIDLVSSHDQLKSSLASAQSSSCEASGKLRSSTRSAVNDAESQAQQGFSKLSQVLEDSVSTLNSDVSALTEEASYHTSQSLTSFTSEVEADFTRQSRSLECSMSALCGSLSEASEDLKKANDERWREEKACEQVKSLLSDQSQLTHQFLHTNLQNDAPTGSTPGKRVYVYPQQVTRGEPVEILRASFRENRKRKLEEMEKENLRKLEQEKEESIQLLEMNISDSDDAKSLQEAAAAAGECNMNETMPIDEFYAVSDVQSKPLCEMAAKRKPTPCRPRPAVDNDKSE